MTITAGYELATDSVFRELSNFSTPPRAGRITAIEASGQVRVESDDPDGGDVLAWPLNGFTYAVGDVVYVGFAVNNPDSALVFGSISPLPHLDPAVVGLTDYLYLPGRAGGQVVTGQSTGVGLQVYRNLAAASTDTRLFHVFQDNAGDDQEAMQVRQDGAGDILSLVSGASEVVGVPVLAGGGVSLLRLGGSLLATINPVTITIAQTWTIDCTLLLSTARVNGIVDISLNCTTSSNLAHRLLYRATVCFERVSLGNVATIVAVHESVNLVAGATFVGPTAIADGIRFTLNPTSFTFNRISALVRFSAATNSPNISSVVA